MIKRKFVPGTEWLYLKIYTGVKTADLILEEAAQPLVEYFQENDFISKWFFIRYNDPKPHLRIRFELNSIDNSNKIIDKINEALYESVESGEISNIIFDTYNREIERYGENTIEDAETLFCKNSEFTFQCLHYDDEEKIIVSLFYIDEMLNKLNLSVQEKLDWIKDFNTAFKQEFNADKKLNSQLDKKYREFKPKYLDFTRSVDFLEERNVIMSNIEESNLALRNIIDHHKNQSLGISLQSFFSSIFHMNINRLFVSNQRLFEMVIYDYLLRYYKMKLYIP
ncbi:MULTISPECIES: thiopeptide-type bacteriocin biosynthesis protein [unclassified Chryseobacterium]|uniref:thiopeptide-type bacteriocin biosynthesis protein n=1 Tax=unclassified Chryseobacterium TaxID=2593645 RepID=UPI000955E758|nr:MULTISPECIES: thiopeptide-type bacteriocin biosynthesis protein [unclassified Chryseobacterium]PXW16668.1 thiopeptide-type bacteriocin biosynthesis protein [Chryseobacterium sp. CBTAP 102]SIQ76642.1 thiopeptide-type bacteriocin biosynthesis domain-containing protein [Chryseobacterium sp. RU33C]